jgi:hypothetical protein
VFTNPYIETTLSKYSSLYIFDDHEFIDNWDEGQTGIYLNAITVWDSYLGLGNPTPVSAGVRYYYKDQADVSFFVMDTRSYRSGSESEDSASKTMLGQTQKQAFFDWLVAKNKTAVFKFIVSSVGWTNLLSKDSWNGYATEREEIFDFIRVRNIVGCVFLSGDSHFLYGRVELDFRGSGLLEFSSSPLSAFSSSAGSVFTKAATTNSTNETVAFYNVGSGSFVSLLSIIDVDTTASTPYFNVSFYEGETFLRQEQVFVSALIPQPKA